MTTGEKMIWAAAYTKYFDPQPPAYIYEEENKWRLSDRKGMCPVESYERGQAVAAADYAWGVLNTLRSAFAAPDEDFGDSELLIMVTEMLRD